MDYKTMTIEELKRLRREIKDATFAMAYSSTTNSAGTLKYFIDQQISIEREIRERGINVPFIR